MTTRETIGVGMLGYAFMGKAHTRAFREADAFHAPLSSQLVSLSGRTADKVEAAREELGWAEAVTDWREQVADERIGLFDNGGPNALHAEPTIRAAEAGKHVLCEKPLACSATDARRMADAFEERSLLLAEAYMTPFHPRSTVLEDVLRSGRLGTLQSARAVFTGPLAPSDNHRWKPDLGGGVLLDLGVYCLAPLLVAAQRLPVEVVGAATTGATGVETAFSAWLDFGDGFRASVEVSYEAPEAQTVEVTGTKGSVLVHRAFTPGEEDTTVHVRDVDGSVEDVGWRGADPYRGLVDHVSTVLQGGDTLRWPVSRSIEVLVLVDTLRAAAARA